MIPKVIHYCWLSGDPIPDKYMQYMQTWNILEGYEFKKWDQTTFDVESHPFVQKCIEKKDWAHASDYIRLWVLYKEGGIYLDCDVVVYKRFDDLLHLNHAFSLELENNQIPLIIDGGVLMCEKGHPFLKQVLDTYRGLTKYNSIQLIGLYLKQMIIKNEWKVNIINNKSFYNPSPLVLNIFTKDYFSPKNYITGEINKTTNSYCCHMFNGDWLKKEDKNYKVNADSSVNLEDD